MIAPLCQNLGGRGLPLRRLADLCMGLGESAVLLLQLREQPLNSGTERPRSSIWELPEQPGELLTLVRNFSTRG